MQNRYRVTASLAFLIMSLCIALTWYSVRPASVAANISLKEHFSFEHHVLSFAAGGESVRKVNPSLQHLASWISAVGAAVAINDLDGDGLANDVCLVDPRTDTVTVAPAPTSPPRYRPFTLVPEGAERPGVAPMGCLPGDFNQDGAMDILVYYWGRPPVMFLFRGNATGTPLSADSYTARDLAPAGERWFSNAALVADFDGDGHVDILIANYFADGAQILDTNDHHDQRLNSSMSHAFNGGGKHIFLGAAGGSDDVTFREASPKLLNADGSQMTATDTNAVLHGWTLAAGTANLGHRMLPDLYLANDFGPDRLLQNESTPGHLQFRLITGHRGFFTPKSKVLGHDSFKGMGVDFADLDNDGRLDILISSITEEFGLQESNLDFVNSCAVSGPVDLSHCLSDRSEELGLARSGWSWDVKAADFDNSGTLQVLQATGFLRSARDVPGVNRWPQLHETAMGNDVLLRFPATWHNYWLEDDLSGHDHNRFFVRSPSGVFTDISDVMGLRHDWVARGISIADVDGDGRLDFAIANQWGPSDIYLNRSAATGAELTLRLLLPVDTSQRFAIAPIGSTRGATWAMTAEATVALPDGRSLLQEVNGGNGHSGKNSFDLHFGLGDAAPDVSVTIAIRWRDLTGRVRARSLQLHPGQYSLLLGS